MMNEVEEVNLAQWLQTPPGQYLLGWEQAQLDKSVANIFGFHAVQLGLPELLGLRDNRMPHRWLAVDAATLPSDCASAVVQCDFDALPFDTQSLDLVVLPHTLELTHDPHMALREVDRVLRPEGRVVIMGLNPTSLWGWRQRLGHLKRRVTLGKKKGLFLPGEGEFIGYRRLRDWLRLLSFELESGHFGCYRPPLVSQDWLSRFQWMESAGKRWWPVFGAVYCVVAVKRVRGIRLIGLAKKNRVQAPRRKVVATSLHNHPKDR
jgi:SAM-dependent methyltransferase